MMHDTDTTSICFRFSFQFGQVSEESLFLRSSYFKLQNYIFLWNIYKLDTNITLKVLRQ